MANEFDNAGDGGIKRDAGDNNAGKLQEDARFDVRESGVGNVDAQRSACETKCGPMKEWMSMKEDPKGFQEKTEKLAAQSPEKIKEAITSNDQSVETVRAFIAGLEAKVRAVFAAQAAGEAMALKQRGAGQ